VNFSSLRDDNVANGIVTHVISDDIIRVAFRSAQDKRFMRINNNKMGQENIVIRLIDLNRSDSIK
jgi:hypothetical protein